MKKLVFCHGLGFNKSIFLPLILSIEAFYGSDKIVESHMANALTNSLSLADWQSKQSLPKESVKTEDSFVFKNNDENQIEIINLDMGYFGDKNLSIDNLDGAIAIGHGLGFNKLLDMNVKWAGIVGISTLLQFIYDDESLRKIDNLNNGLNINGELALKSFISRLSNNEVVINLPYPNADINLIKTDVEYLKNTNSSKVLQKKSLPTLFLHGGKDNWCDVAIAKQQLKDYNLLINAESSHILGFLHALWCRDNILKFIDKLHPVV